MCVRRPIIQQIQSVRYHTSPLYSNVRTAGMFGCPLLAAFPPSLHNTKTMCVCGGGGGCHIKEEDLHGSTGCCIAVCVCVCVCVPPNFFNQSNSVRYDTLLIQLCSHCSNVCVCVGGGG